MMLPLDNMKRIDFTGNSGLNITLQSPEDPQAYFESFLTSDILSPVVDENMQVIKIVQHDFDKIIFTTITVW